MLVGVTLTVFEVTTGLIWCATWLIRRDTAFIFIVRPHHPTVLIYVGRTPIAIIARLVSVVGPCRSGDAATGAILVGHEQSTARRSGVAGKHPDQ